MSDSSNHLLLSAFHLFRKLGFKHVTMDDVARNAGVSKKTLYEHFEDKDNLVLACIRHMLDENQCHTDAVFREAKNAIEQITRILIIMQKMLGGLNPVCYVDLQRHYPDAYQYLQQHKETYLLRCISDNLSQGIAEGLYRDDIDIDIMTRFRMESAMLVFSSQLFPEGNHDLVRANRQIFAHYIYGITTLKGHKLFQTYLQKLTNS